MTPHPIPIPHTCDAGPGARARLGLIVLQTDETIEGELSRLLLADGVALFTSRIPMADQVTPKTLAQMKRHLRAAAALLPPVSVAAYACTSGAATLGSDTIAQIVSQGAPAAKITDPLAALIAALRAQNAKRLALAAPYAGSVCAALCDALHKNGITITSLVSFQQPSDAIVARIDARSISAAARAAAQKAPADALFISCTNLRALPLIAPLEAELKIPVLSSNTALAWHMSTLAGLAPAPHLRSGSTPVLPAAPICPTPRPEFSPQPHPSTPPRVTLPTLRSGRRPILQARTYRRAPAPTALPPQPQTPPPLAPHSNHPSEWQAPNTPSAHVQARNSANGAPPPPPPQQHD